MRGIALGVGGLVLLGLLLFAATGFNLGMLRFWGPQFQDARRDIFEHSQSYVQGKVSHLSRLRAAYEAADAGPAKESFRRQLLTEASTIDLGLLPAELQAFLRSIGEGR
jgi:hypothetical protein